MKNNYLYQGTYSELDEDIGWNDFALRNYDPQTGRWVQQDPFKEYSSSYIGFGADPINLIDPSGGFTKAGVAAVMTLGGAILGTVASLVSGDDDFTGTLIGIGAGIGAGLSNLSMQIAIKMGLKSLNIATRAINSSGNTTEAGNQFKGTNDNSNVPRPSPSREPGIDPEERVRILSAIGLGEGGNGYTFSIWEIVQIAYVYVHKEAKGKPLGHGSSFYAKKGVAYRMYMYLFGSPKYAKDKEAIAESKKIGKSHTEKVKWVYEELKCFQDSNPNKGDAKDNIPAADNPDITVQGYHGDLNGYQGDPTFWNRVRWYVYYVYTGKIPKTNNLYVFLGTDAEHKNATFLIDEQKLNKFVNDNKDWIDTKQAPIFDPKTNTFKPNN